VLSLLSIDVVPADIEQYETASQRYYGGRTISVLLCLARSWYVKASKEQSFASMTIALQFTQKVRPPVISVRKLAADFPVLRRCTYSLQIKLSCTISP
jgi:hypothetical protein